MLPDGWARAQGTNRGMAEVVSEVGAISCRRGQFPMGRRWKSVVRPPTAVAPRGGEGGKRADEPIKKWYLADGWGGARGGREGERQRHLHHW